MLPALQVPLLDTASVIDVVTAEPLVGVKVSYSVTVLPAKAEPDTVIDCALVNADDVLEITGTLGAVWLSVNDSAPERGLVLP